MHTIEKTRNTKETEINIIFNPKGTGRYEISTEFKFFNHMLEQFAFHGGFDIKLCAKSLDCNLHHLVEDVAIVLGKAFFESLEDKIGIKRYNSVILPMDEALILCAVDVSGRPYCKVDFEIKDEATSDFETVLLPHFYHSFAQNAGITLNIKQLDGKDAHHIIECSIKAFARALKGAIEVDLLSPDTIPSTKGVL